MVLLAVIMAQLLSCMALAAGPERTLVEWTFAVESIRLLELAMPPATAQSRFDFTKDRQGWQPVAGATLVPGDGSAAVKTATAEGFILAPPLGIAAEDALPRAGVATTLVATVTNTGGRAAANVRATLRLPPGATALEAAPAVASIEFAESAVFKWRVQAAEPLAGEAELMVLEPGQPPARARAARRLLQGPLPPLAEVLPALG